MLRQVGIAKQWVAIDNLADARKIKKFIAKRDVPSAGKGHICLQPAIEGRGNGHETGHKRQEYGETVPPDEGVGYKKVRGIAASHRPLAHSRLKRRESTMRRFFHLSGSAVLIVAKGFTGGRSGTQRPPPPDDQR